MTADETKFMLTLTDEQLHARLLVAELKRREIEGMTRDQRLIAEKPPGTECCFGEGCEKCEGKRPIRLHTHSGVLGAEVEAEWIYPGDARYSELKDRRSRK